VKLAKTKQYIKRTIKNFLYKISNNPTDYFKDPHKVYLASADQFAGMASIYERESLLQCKHFYSVIGGLGGLNILSRMQYLESITFFDINPFSIKICELLFRIIKSSNSRDEFISLVYARCFDSKKFSIENQAIFYNLPLDANILSRLENILGKDLYEIYTSVYIPYISSPPTDLYTGFSIHCTRLTIFHEAKLNDIMVYPFEKRESMRKKRLSSVNSFFFGKGWLKSEESFIAVKNHLISSRVTIINQSIFDLNPQPHSGLYASNVFEGSEEKFDSLISRFSWTLWYSRQTEYLKLEYIYPSDRVIPITKVYGRGCRNVHKTCCYLLNDTVQLESKKFLEVIHPHATEGMNYGFRFYQGQCPISVDQFLKSDFLIDQLSFIEIIGIHILLGGGCPVQKWKDVVLKAVSSQKPVFLFEHRKNCSDWPEDDVDLSNILPEKEIDNFLLSISRRWQKYGTANSKGNIKDIRNICWVLKS
jgi:hypothetical protein